MPEINVHPLFQQMTTDTGWSRFFAYGGRGGGKSFCFADYIINNCHDHRETVYCIREFDKDIEKSFKELFRRRIVDWGLSGFFKIFTDHISAENGSTIYFMGLSERRSGGAKGITNATITWVMEANQLSRASLIVLFPSALREPGSRILCDFNVESKRDPIWDYVNKEDEKSRVVEMNFDQNPFITEELLHEAEECKKYNPALFPHIWLGKPLDECLEVRVFKNIQATEIQTLGRPLFGMDFGFYPDPVAIIMVWLLPKAGERAKLYIQKEFYAQSVEIDDLPRIVRDFQGEYFGYPIICDRNGKQAMSFMKRHGCRVIPTENAQSPNGIIDGVRLMKAFDIIINPNCPNALREFGNYCHDVDRMTGAILEDKLKGGDDHLIDTARYALDGYQKRSDYRASFEAIAKTLHNIDEMEEEDYDDII